MEMSERVPGIGLGQHEDRVGAEPGDRLRLFAGALVGSEDEQLVPDVLALSDSQGCLSS